MAAFGVLFLHRGCRGDLSKKERENLLFVSRIVSPEVLEWDSTAEGGRWGDSKPKEPATLSKLSAFWDAPSYWPKHQ